MFTLHDTLKRIASHFLPACLAFALCTGAAITAEAQLRPANEYLANAQGINDSTGSVDVLNVNAIPESGEPTPDNGGAPIWFIWTAPYTTMEDFTTLQSSDTNGVSLDTVLVFYKLKSGGSLTYTNLQGLATNDNDPSGGVTSRIDVSVTEGQTYLIQVLGSSNNPTPGFSCAEGNVNLSWSPSLVAGSFSFSASTYYAGEFDDYWLANFSPNSVAESLFNPVGSNNVRVTVVRNGGGVGKCQVTLSTTNVTFTNLFQTNLSGTNIFMTYFDTNGKITSFTNIYETVVACQNVYTNFVGSFTSGGGFQGFPVWNVYEVIITNYNPSGPGPSGTMGMTNVVSIPLTGLGLTNFFTNWPNVNTTTSVTNTNAPASIITTQLFNLGTNGTNLFGQQIFIPAYSTNRTTPSASNSLDYISINTNLTFNDFEMSKDIYLNVNPTDTYLLGPDYPDANANYGYAGMNSLVLLTLSNPTNVPGENPNILPPTISTGANVVSNTTNANAYVDIMNFLLNPNNYIGSPQYLETNTAFGTYATLNFERAEFRCNRVPDGSGVQGTNAYLYMEMLGNYSSSASYTFHYTVDCETVATPGVDVTPIDAFDWNRFPTEAGSDYAVPAYYTGPRFPDFGDPVNNPPDPSTLNVGKNTTFPGGAPYYGTFTVGPTLTQNPWAEIAIPIMTNGAVEFDQDMVVQVFQTPEDYAANSTVAAQGGQLAPCYLGNIAQVNLTINFTGEPGGAYDTTFNPDDASANPEPGATPGEVLAMALQPNGQAIIGGSFEYYDEQTTSKSFRTATVYGITRLTTNGYLDQTFNANFNDAAGVGAGGNSVAAIALDPSGKIYIGGSFSSYDNLPNTVNNIARLNSDGTLDTSFNTGLGFDGPVNALALDSNGNIIVGGDFGTYQTTLCSNIVRLLPSGALDPSFLPNIGNGLNYGASDPVSAIAIDHNGNIVIGGEFTNFSGVSLSYVARLLTNGSVDPSFAPAVGPDDVVNGIAIEPNNEILIGGAFANYNSISSSGVALLTYNGGLDTSFVPGAGADGTVNTVALQPDGEILVGGQFRNFNSVRRMGIARLLTNGWLDTSFMDTSYNQFAGLIQAATTDPINQVFAMAVQADGNILIGGSFTNIGGGTARNSIHTQLNMTRLIGAPTPGPMTGGGVTNNNCPGNITFAQNFYTALDTQGKLYVPLERTNGSLGPAQVTLGTNLLAPGPGDATSADLGLISASTVALFNDVHNIWTILPYGSYGWRDSDGFYGVNNNIQPTTDFGESGLTLNIFNDPSAGQNLLADLSLLNVTSQGLLSLGGVPIPTYPAVGLPEVQLDILDNNINPGVVGFSASNYTALDTVGSVTLTVLRTNGNYGALNLQYYTVNGSAISTNNYVGVTAGKGTPIKFTGGVNGNNSFSFTIPITLKTTVQPTTQFTVYLTNTSVGGTINTNEPPFVYPSATVTIQDGNFAPGHLAFTNASYTVLKPGIATIGVARTAGSQGQLTVQCGTSDGSGTNGVNYIGVTNTLSWGAGDVSVKTMTVQTLQDNTVEGTKTVNLSLFNATNTVGANNNSILLGQTNSFLNILDSDKFGGLSFVANNFNIFQNSGLAIITVTRTNGTTGTITVGYTNFTDTNAINLGPQYAPAIAGTNFGSTNGVLTFGPGVTSQSFAVPIYYTPGDPNYEYRMVMLELFNPSTNVNGSFPEFATLTILNPQQINHPPGSIDPAAYQYLGTGFNGTVNSVALQPASGNVVVGGAFTLVDNYPFNYVTELLSDAHYNIDFLGNATGGNVDQVFTQNPPGSTNDGPILVAGNFTNIDGVNRNAVARLNLDGSLDETFNPNAGADNSILAVAETFLPTAVINQTSLAYYVAGDFANYNGVEAGGIARLNASSNSPGPQGALDPNFNVLQGVTSGAGGIHAVAVQANGQVILGGDFTAFNSQPYNHMVRLNEDGSVDPTFLPNTTYGPQGAVRAIAIQPDGQILIGGLFTNVGGSNLNYLARLNGSDGSVDPTFNPQGGGNNAVLALALDSQNRILVGGEFTRFGGVSRDGITRLATNGNVDPTIDFGSGADGGFVDAIVVDSSDEIDVGGGFTSFEGQIANNFIRLFGLSKVGNGTFQFTQETFGVVVNPAGTNAIVTIQRQGPEGTNALGSVTVQFSTADGTPTNYFQPGIGGVDYTPVITNVTFPYGEVFETVSIPILPNSVVGSNKVINLNLSGQGYVSGIIAASLYLTNNNSAVSFSNPSIAVSPNPVGGNANVPVVRTGNTNSTVSVTVSTGTGTATPNVVYTPTTSTLLFNPGVTLQYFQVPVLNPPNYFSDQSVPLLLSSPSNTTLVSPTTCLMTINGSNGPGVISFAQPAYTVLAPVSGVSNAAITINQTENLSNTVSVIMTTSNGTATAGVQYAATAVTNYFTDQSNAVVNIPIYPQAIAGPATTVILTLTNVAGGASLSGPTQETLTILNAIESVSLTNLPYAVNESNSTFTVTVARGGPATNTALSVGYYTYTPPNTTEAQGYAQPDVDYAPVSGTLTLGPGAQSTSFTIPILQGNTVNANPLTFEVGLDNASPTNVQIGPTGVTTVSIVGDVTGFSLSSSNYFIGENGSNVVINVSRVNANTGAATVRFATSDGNNVNGSLNASNAVDYAGTNGTLTFANGQTSASFSVPILNKNVVEGNKTFNVALSNPTITIPNSSYTNAFLVSPSSAAVTITNVLTGVSFGSPNYDVSECSGLAEIPIVLTGAATGNVTVNFSTTTGGSATPGLQGNYLPVSNTVTFTNGQTVVTDTVPILNNHIIGPNHTVYLELTGANGAQLLNPSTAVLTIDECNGAYIVGSGTAFVSGNISPGSGVIFPNENVTMLFGLRDVAGSNTTSLVATLLATNGVTNVSGPQNYGVLVTNGATVSRQFSFTAIGTNGQNISANLALVDGSQVYSNVDFGFTIGGVSTTFTNNESLLLFGSNNPPSKATSTTPPYYGYPSVINVTGIVGTVTGVSAGISNFGHSYPSDISAVLEGPNGSNSMLMENCGYTNSVSHVNLTFSQSASSSLPQYSALTTGTYLPTSYGTQQPLPTSSGGITVPQRPFPLSLNTFVGQPANGTWALFVADDDTLDSGYISNGWFLTIATGVPVVSASDLEMTLSAPTTTFVSNSVTYSITVSNAGPANATNIVVTDTLPPGLVYTGSTCGCTVSTNSLASGLLTFTFPTLSAGSEVTMSFNALANTAGYLTNSAVAISSELELNVNNEQTNVVNVSTPSADLGVTLSDSPFFVTNGTVVTYTVVVSNAGPAAATSVIATNTLPSGFVLLTNMTQVSSGAVTNTNTTTTWTIGSMTNGASQTMTLQAGAAVASTGNYQDNVTVGSAVLDPNKANNFASVKTGVMVATLALSPGSGTNYTLSWAASSGFILQGTTNLPPVWINITNSSVTQQTTGGVTSNLYTLPGTNGFHFFRLKAQLP